MEETVFHFFFECTSHFVTTRDVLLNEVLIKLNCENGVAW